MIKILTIICAMLLVSSSAFAGSKHFGDEVTLGLGSSIPTKSYVSVLDTALTATTSNYSAVNAQAADQAIVARGVTSAATDTITVMLGATDCRKYPTAFAKSHYKNLLREVIASQIMPTRVTMRDAMMTLTGKWVNPKDTWSVGKASNDKSATASARVAGTAVYVGVILEDAFGKPLAGDAEVFVDGASVGRISSNGEGFQTSAGIYRAPATFRFSGLAAGAHTVLIKMVSGTVGIEYIAGSTQPASASVYVANIFKTSLPGDPCSGAQFTTFNAIIADLAKNFTDDGRSVTLVDNSTLLSAGDMVDKQFVQNDVGHQKLSDSFYFAMKGAKPPIVYSKTNIYLGSDGFYYSGDAPGSVKQIVTK